MHPPTTVSRETGTVSRIFRAVTATLTTLMLAAFGVMLPATAQANDSEAFSLSVDYTTNDRLETYNGVTVATPNTLYTAGLGYDATKIVPGSTIVIDVPEGVTFPNGVPVDNTRIESVELNTDGDIEVTFKVEEDTTNVQGEIFFAFSFTPPANGSAQREVTWTAGSITTTQQVIVKAENDNFRPDLSTGLEKKFTSQQAKNSAEASLRAAITRNNTTGVVTINSTVTNTPIPYQISIVSEATRTVTLEDEISQFLEFDKNSFSAELTTWDAQGFNGTTVPFPIDNSGVGSQTFVFADLDLPANSILTLSYEAKVATSQVAALQTELQASADLTDAGNTEGKGGPFSVAFENVAELDNETSEQSLSITGSIPAEPVPGYGQSIKKTSSIPKGTPIQVEEGEIVLPRDVTYTFAASLTPWRGFEGTRHELKQNVILHDTPNDSIVWKNNPPTSDFLTVTSGNLTLTAAAKGVTDAEFKSDAGVGTYRITEPENRLEINIGRDTSKVYTIAAKAQIVNDEYLKASAPAKNQPQVETVYKISNVAFFDYNGKDVSTRSTAEVEFHQPKAPGSVIDDATEFDKAVGPIGQMTKGEPYQVPFTFTVAAGAVPDLRLATIVDDINDEVFDVNGVDAAATASKLANIKDSITGSYAGSGPNGLNGSDFDLTIDADGNLLITVSDTFGANLPVAQRPAAGAVLDKAMTLKINIPTFTVTGKQTFDISNSARLIHTGSETYTWTSEAVSNATSYGNELEVNKLVYTPEEKWANSVRVELDNNGELVNDTFVYRVNVVPHGSYNGRLFDLVDVLPKGVKLLGFVDDKDLSTGKTTTDTSINLDANLKASLNLENNTVTIAQLPNTRIPVGQSASVNFSVQVTEFTQDLPIVNRIAGATASIIPSSGYPLIIEKLDDTRDTVSITDRASLFTVTGPDNQVVTDEAYVVNGQLMVADADGKDTSIVIPEGDGGVVPAGTYTVTEQKPPAGYAQSNEQVTVTIRPNGTITSAKFYNTPLDLFAIGDVVWIDENRDGLQTAGEPRLAGVTVNLLNADGTFVQSTTTNEQGEYLFDLLPAGDYRVSFTLTDAQAAEYTFTAAAQGDNVAVNSDATLVASEPGVPGITGMTGVIALNADNAQLVAASDYAPFSVKALNGIDPTWDAGVVKRSYAVGDYVWIDANRNGLQDVGEAALPGVMVELLNPDGTPAVNVRGAAIAPTTTDSSGRYLFDNLAEGDYQVRFTLTPEQEARYAFTTPNALGSGLNSDAVSFALNERLGVTKTLSLNGENGAVTTTYDRALLATEGIDPTWDAGVVARAVSVGDRVWIDTNNDGRQGENEPGIPGVVLEITGPTGDPVTDVFGNPVAPVTTDENGNYRFVNLPVLADGQSYTVTINQDASAEALTDLQPTTAGNGDREGDSSTWTASSEGLTQNNQSDLTLDFGFVQSVSVGDRVWIDTNNDGRQGENEPGIPGVVLEITGPTGDPVTDVFGNPVAPVTTDENGNYRFVNLPVLADGQSYTVTINQDASAEALTGLVPTRDEVGDRAGDSSKWFTVSEGLNSNGEYDGSLDFGLVSIKYLEAVAAEAAAKAEAEAKAAAEAAAKEAAEAEAQAAAEAAAKEAAEVEAAAAAQQAELSQTGSDTALPLIGGSIAALLIILGAGAVIMSRRRS